MEFVIISGLSGAGKSKAASFLEDMDYFCVDNLPAPLIPKFAELGMAGAGEYDRVALVTDIRAGSNFDLLFQALDALEGMRCPCRILFMDASDEVIIKRYKETRRAHPLLEEADSLEEAIKLERTMLAPLRARADKIINTTNLSTAKLKGVLRQMFGRAGTAEGRMEVRVTSFGFKHGDYAFQGGQGEGFLQRLWDLVGWLLPLYEEEGKTALVISIGCTGGHHRSVAVAHALADRIRAQGWPVTESHRDLGRN